MILLVNSGGEAAVPEWQAEFRAVAPHLDVRWWQDPGMDLAEVAYVFVWSLMPG
jgi:glyoxylate/hydroxypyruvate reductase A